MRKKRFYYIVKDQGSAPRAVALFKEACSKRGITAVEIASSAVNLSQPPDFIKGDMLYRISVDKKASTIFKVWGSQYPVSTLYADIHSLIASGDNVWTNTMLHEAANLPIIKSVFDLPADKSMLESYAEALGGFPIIVKAAGGSHGVGVMRIDSLQSLYSVAEVLQGFGGHFLLRSYVDHTICARLIVLGDKVVDSLAYERVANDFRTNTGNELHYYPKKFSTEIEKLAVDSTNALNVEFGGVDVLLATDGNYYLAEVNTPCNFARCQDETGTDIAGMIIDHLLSKNAS